jgi:hypothetical protein
MFAGGVTNAGLISTPVNVGIDVDTLAMSKFSGGVSNTGTVSAAVGIFVGAVAFAGQTASQFSSFSGGIVNSGTIIVNSHFFGAGPEAGILLGGLAQTHSVVAIGTIGGGITNAGAISVASGVGISIGGSATAHASFTISAFAGGIANAGTISASTGIKIGRVSTFTGDITNTGVISGKVGINVSGVRGVGVFDVGTIIGSGGTAVRFDAGSATFTLAPGYLVGGKVIAESGGTLQLGGAGAANFNLSSVGTQYTGFTAFDVVGGIWTASGAGSGGWTVENGAALRLVNGASGGLVEVGNGLISVLSGGTANIFFAPTGSGQLRIADAADSSTVFSGTISGFGGANHGNQKQSIDLVDVAFTSGAITSRYVSSGGNTSGTLFVSSGSAEVAAINFVGSYTASNFHISSGGVGVIITDPGVVNGGAVTDGAALTFPRDGVDLPNIAFSAHTTLAYAENAAGTGGTLTVSDGRHAASIALLGTYMAASFVMTADGHGGALVTEASQHGAAPLLARPLT